MVERIPPNRNLTPQQVKVAQLVALEYTDQEIPNELGIALQTAKRHASDIRIRLNVRTRAGTATWVVQQGLLDGRDA
ncbi:MAG: LuxR C-terminal-related transcriptional regulator [Dehalococcoidia bacterium]